MLVYQFSEWGKSGISEMESIGVKMSDDGSEFDGSGVLSEVGFEGATESFERRVLLHWIFINYIISGSRWR